MTRVLALFLLVLLEALLARATFPLVLPLVLPLLLALSFVSSPRAIAALALIGGATKELWSGLPLGVVTSAYLATFLTLPPLLHTWRQTMPTLLRAALAAAVSATLFLALSVFFAPETVETATLLSRLILLRVVVPALFTGATVGILSRLYQTRALLALLRLLGVEQKAPAGRGFAHTPVRMARKDV